MADDELLQRLHRLERLALGSRDGYWERDLKRGTSWYSPSFRAMFGFAEGELPNDRDVVNARIHRDDIAAFLARYDAALAQLAPFTYEVRYLDAAEQWRWVRGRGRVWPGADGTAEFITGAISDVHAEKTAQESLRALGERFERAIDASAEGLFERVVGEPGMYMSDRYLELTGDTRQTAPTEPEQLAQRLHPDDIPRYRSIVGAAMRSGQRWELSYRFRHAAASTAGTASAAAPSAARTAAPSSPACWPTCTRKPCSSTSWSAPAPSWKRWWPNAPSGCRPRWPWRATASARPSGPTPRSRASSPT